MNRLFFECSKLLLLPDIYKWNTVNVTSMIGMFYDCSSLYELPDISKWNVNNVKDMTGMFKNCTSLSSFPDILKWNLNNSLVTNDMFCNFSKKAITDPTRWKNYQIKFKFNSTLIGDTLDTFASNIVNLFF